MAKRKPPKKPKPKPERDDLPILRPRVSSSLVMGCDAFRVRMDKVLPK